MYWKVKKMCRSCGETGRMGSPGYFIYCNCESGRKRKASDIPNDVNVGEGVA